MLLKSQQVHFHLKLFEFEEKLRILMDFLLYWKKLSRPSKSLMYKRNITNWVTSHGQSFKIVGGNLCSGFFFKTYVVSCVGLTSFLCSKVGDPISASEKLSCKLAIIFLQQVTCRFQI